MGICVFSKSVVLIVLMQNKRPLLFKLGTVQKHKIVLNTKQSKSFVNSQIPSNSAVRHVVLSVARNILNLYIYIYLLKINKYTVLYQVRYNAYVECYTCGPRTSPHIPSCPYAENNVDTPDIDSYRCGRLYSGISRPELVLTHFLVN